MKKSKFSDTKFVSILKQAAAGEGALPPAWYWLGDVLQLEVKVLG